MYMYSNVNERKKQNKILICFTVRKREIRIIIAEYWWILLVKEKKLKII